jgi:hypothetical protein
MEEGELARSQPLASGGLAIGGEGLLVDLQHLGLGEAVEAPISERVQGGSFGTGGLDRQAYQPPRLATPARDRAYGIYGLLVGGARLMAVLSPKVARRALGDVQAFGDRPQVGEVVQSDAPNKLPSIWGTIF